jgi:hypothetical protein
VWITPKCQGRFLRDFCPIVLAPAENSAPIAPAKLPKQQAAPPTPSRHACLWRRPKAALPTRSPNSTIQKTRCWSCPPSHVNHDHVEHRHAANVGRGPRRLAARAISRCRGAWTRASVASVGRFGFSKPGVTVTATADFVGESGVIPVEQFAPGAVNLELKQIAGISMKNVQ